MRQMKFLYLFLILLGLSSSGCSDTRTIPPGISEDGCPERDTTNISHEISSPARIKVYIETSGSMRGFMPTQADTETEFQKVISDLFLRLSGELTSVEYYSIIETDMPVKRLTADSARISVIKGKFRWGNYTELPRMLDTIFQALDSETVSIFISDLVYSPIESETEKDYLSRIRESARRLKDTFSIQLYALMSEFIDENGKMATIPYYVMIVGNQEKSKKPLEILHATFSTFTQRYNDVRFGMKYKPPFYSIIPNTGRTGPGIAVPCPGFDNVFLKLQDIGDNEPIGYIVGIDLSQYPGYVSQSIRLDTSFTASTRFSSNVTIDSVLSSKSLNSHNVTREEKILLDKSTNLLKMAVTLDANSEYDLISINLKNNLPVWIDEYSSNDQNDITRTYGLKSTIAGLNQGIRSNGYLFENLKLTFWRE